MIAVLVVLSACSHGSPSVTFNCPSGAPLRGIYSPDRLQVIAPCRWFRGTVVQVEDRSDGDKHLLLRPDPGYTKFLNVTNVNDGGLVVEIVPGQKLPIPAVEDHVAIFGTWVLDTHNDWNEIHPVWGIRYLSRGFSAFALPPATPLYTAGASD